MPFGFGKGGGKGGRRRFRGDRSTGVSGRGDRTVNCICPNCGTLVPHQPSLPCFQTKCPQCNSLMARQFYNEK
ncbi:MAG: hypothetical protein SVR08_15490 [Spirochaetota bacterium]|nr:hypothetical protein [Spirochaetota bacterium]